MLKHISNSAIRIENLIKNKNFSSLEKLLVVICNVLEFNNDLLAKIICYQRKTPYTEDFISAKKLRYTEKLWIYSN